ncbi:MAG: hypothetical protein DCF31_09635 [Alphaproteobacteria bacterium]|nr:MAG: hypothetical protein DCF31_09635 [Alphaproteobacteria bacterium]
MGKGYPLWVKDTFEYKTITQSYRAHCHSHELETTFHADAKRQFAALCRGNATHGPTYNHNNISVSANKHDNDMGGGLLLTGY